MLWASNWIGGISWGIWSMQRDKNECCIRFLMTQPSSSSRLISAIGAEVPTTGALQNSVINNISGNHNKHIQALPCLWVNIGHHHLEHIGLLLLNVIKSADMTLIYIKVCIGCKTCGDVNTSAPLIQCSIELLIKSYQDSTFERCGLNTPLLPPMQPSELEPHTLLLHWAQDA